MMLLVAVVIALNTRRLGENRVPRVPQIVDMMHKISKTLSYLTKPAANEKNLRQRQKRDKVFSANPAAN